MLAGDFNIDFGNKNHKVCLIQNLLDSFNFSMHVESPTRFSKFSSTILDYVCSNFPCSTCDVVNCGLSDHEAVISCFEIKLDDKKHDKKYRRIFSRKNFENFEKETSNVFWEDILKNSDPLANFHSQLKSVFNISFPLTPSKIKSRKPWITNGIKTSSKNLRSLHYIRKYAIDNLYFLSYFNKYRAVFRKIIKAAKHQYFENRLASASNMCRESWRITNELSGKYNGPLVRTNFSADEINNYYCSIAENTSINISAEEDPAVYIKNIFVRDSFFLAPTNTEEIIDTLKEIRNKNTSGWDDISAKVLLHVPVNALAILGEAINISFSSGIFPACLKIAIINPLPKGGDCELISNLRPISLLPTLAKLVEKLVKKRMTTFLMNNHLLSNCQFGFRESRSTNDAMFSLLEYIYISALMRVIRLQPCSVTLLKLLIV